MGMVRTADKMKSFRRSSIHQKLTAIILATSCLALGLASVGYALYERANYRAMLASELSALGDTLGANTAASLMFNDRKSAREMLGALQSEKHIMAGCLYDRGGKVFAEYCRPGRPHTFEIPGRREDGARFEDGKMKLSRQVIIAKTPIR